MKLAYRARSEVGPVRSLNEDCFAVNENQSAASPGSLFIVCDGRGGPQLGDVAAALAADTILATYYAAEGLEPEQALREAFQAANQRIYQRWSNLPIRVTAVAALLNDGQVFIASVGDCRAYHYGHGQLQQITADHTFYDELIREGRLTRADVQTYSTNITRLRALGELLELKVDVFKLVLQQKEALLLCTDGLHGYVENAEIEETLAAAPREGTIDRCIDLVYARCGRDNVTAVLIWSEE
jgi:serine/threonine protein phosphatase PrpC